MAAVLCCFLWTLLWACKQSKHWQKFDSTISWCSTSMIGCLSINLYIYLYLSVWDWYCKLHKGATFSRSCSISAVDCFDVFQLFGESSLQNSGRDLQSVGDADGCVKHAFKSFGLLPDSGWEDTRDRETVSKEQRARPSKWTIKKVKCGTTDWTHVSIPTSAPVACPFNCSCMSSSASSTAPWQVFWSSWTLIIFSLITSSYLWSPSSAPTNCIKLSITALFPRCTVCMRASCCLSAFGPRDDVLKWTAHLSSWGSSCSVGEDGAAGVNLSWLLLVLSGSSLTACIVLLVPVSENMSKPEPHSSLWQSIGVAMDTQAKMKGIKHILIWN